MTYLGWGRMYEGGSDARYFDILIPRVMEALVLAHGTRSSTVPTSPAVVVSREDVSAVAKEACKGSVAFHLFFIHADRGGRALEAEMQSRSCAYCEAMRRECAWPPARCVVVAPRKETEAWMLADDAAVTFPLGYAGSSRSLGLPANANEAERCPDPKETLATAIRQVRGRRRAVNVDEIIPAIAQSQSLAKLREGPSFADFEAKLRAALADLRCVTPAI